MTRESTMLRTIVTIPTYNERENIDPLLDAILNLGAEGLETLVVDDDSPDRTAAAVQQVASRRPGVHLLVRTTERGRGTAGVAGFRRALEMKADLVFEMDADFSHHPRHLPDMVRVLRDREADMVVGSRFIQGGRDADRPFRRRLISELARRYIRLVLGVKPQDVTSGYRGFTAALLEACDLATCRASGPSILLEILFRATLKGFSIKEVPIEFCDRTRGQSTLTFKILLQSLIFVPRLRMRGW
ncbi:MAG: polyprenol monophosphomannose synthase [Candidatus Riflebacteria bacterium]|nr:polyprenol monophosphomannose synthase [Candidatus Riflebacteria bacterium]